MDIILEPALAPRDYFHRDILDPPDYEPTIEYRRLYNGKKTAGYLSNYGTYKRRWHKDGRCTFEKPYIGNNPAKHRRCDSEFYILFTGEYNPSIKKRRKTFNFLPHREVLNLFRGPVLFMQTDHLNNYNHDNRVENLEWVTASENVQRRYRLQRNPVERYHFEIYKYLN